jgi:hypothetical protein
MSFDEIVVDHYFMTVVHQLFRDDAADVAGPSGNKHTHATNLLREIRDLLKGARSDEASSGCLRDGYIGLACGCVSL